MNLGPYADDVMALDLMVPSARSGDPLSVLNARWDKANSDRPILAPETTLAVKPSGAPYYETTIHSSMIASHNGSDAWGQLTDVQLKRLTDSVETMAQRLATEGNYWWWYGWFAHPRFPVLREIPGPKGPMYICLDGSEKVNLAVGMGLKRMPAVVQPQRLLMLDEEYGLRTSDRAHVKKLVKNGDVDLHGFVSVSDTESVYKLTLNRRVSTPWELLPPKQRDEVIRCYMSRRDPFGSWDADDQPRKKGRLFWR